MFSLNLQIVHLSFEAFTAVIQVEVFWVATPCSVVVGYRRFGGSMELSNVGILSQHYTTSQPM
jgi:hypothetical protein